MAEEQLIEVTLNGKSYPTRANIPVRALLEQLGLGLDYVAVELNHAIVKRKDWERTTLHPGDRIEVVRFVGGGKGNL